MVKKLSKLYKMPRTLNTLALVLNDAETVATGDINKISKRVTSSL